MTLPSEHVHIIQTARWQAVMSRDAEADGTFFYAVRSTGIYCRPACPSKRPKREKVLFFDTSEEAEGAGFRPCLRCRPNEINARQQLVARVQHLLDQHLLDTPHQAPTLAQLGEAVGLSACHLQRVFKAVTGISPKEYLLAKRTERFKAGLKDGSSVTTAMYEAGYGSSRALYDKAQERLGMKPGAYKNGGQGEGIVYDLFDSPRGRMLIAATEKGVCALRFGEDEALLKELAAEFPRATLGHDARTVAPYRQAVLSNLRGAARQLSLPLDVDATDFQERVWAALRAIPYGETRSYREVAEMIGQPNAVRAVARACATNPVALAIPCHRVVSSSGALSGYRWGTGRKQSLLEAEGRAVSRTSEG